jgi:hypothetical protein
MSFYQKYELMKLVHNGEPKTFQARETSSGRIVYLHLLGNVEAGKQSKLLADLQERRRSFPSPEQSGVIDLDDSKDAPYVVTQALEGLPTLWDWIDTWSLMPRPVAAAPAVAFTPPAPPAPPPPLPPPPPVAAPVIAQPAAAPVGEFTQMFLGNVPPAAAPAPPPAAGGPGEFTRMFLGPAGAAPPPPAPVSPAFSPPPAPAAPAPAPAAAEPGEFTRMFLGPTPKPAPPPPPAHPEFARLATQEFQQSPVAPPPQQPPPFEPPAYRPPEPAPPPAAAKQGPGEFTRFFAGPLGANPLPVEDVERGLVTPPPAPASRPFQGPSDFTMRFGGDEQAPSAGAPSYNAPAYNAPGHAGDATGLFSSSASMPRESVPIIQGPSEFTRVLQGAPSSSSTPAAPAYSAPPAAYIPPASAPKSQLNTIVIAVISFLGLALVLTAVFLLLRR